MKRCGECIKYNKCWSPSDHKELTMAGGCSQFRRSENPIEFSLRIEIRKEPLKSLNALK